MALTHTDGSQTATINTEHTLFTTNVPGTYVCTVDTTNMADGDVVELRAKRIVKASGSARAELQRYADAQPDGWRLKVSLPYTNGLTDTGAMVFTLKQVKGTGRAYDFNVEALTP